MRPLQEISRSTTFIYSIFWYNRHFWQHWALQWIYFPVSVHDKISSISIFVLASHRKEIPIFAQGAMGPACRRHYEVYINRLERLVTALDNNFNLPVVVVTLDILQCYQHHQFCACLPPAWPTSLYHRRVYLLMCMRSSIIGILLAHSGDILRRYAFLNF